MSKLLNNVNTAFKKGVDGNRKFLLPKNNSNLFQDILKNSIKNDNLKNITLKTGIGLSKQNILPLRVISLIIPGLEILKNLKKEKEIKSLPKFLIYQALDFIIETNNLEKETSYKNSLYIENILKNFVKLFYSEIEEYVIFDFIKGKYGDESKKEIFNISKKININLSSEVLNNLNNQGKKHSLNEEENSYLKYLAANIFYSGGGEYYPFEKHNLGKDVIIPIGGRSEKIFFETLSEYNQNQEKNIIPLYSNVSQVAPYYGDKKGDIYSFDDLALFFNGKLKKEIGHGAKNDLLVIQKCIGNNFSKLKSIYE